MVLKTFVERTKDLTKEELMEYIGFCQLLPGASSTQTLTLMGYKRGGIQLAVITLIIWIFPACFLMGALTFIVGNIEKSGIQTNIFRFIQPMAIGFLAYAAIRAYQISIKNTITKVIMVISAAVTFFLFKAPWIIPALIVCGGIATNFSSRRIPEKEIVKPKHIGWTNIWLFVMIFLIAGVLSETARKQKWENRKQYNLFENFYRFGSFVIGGGDVTQAQLLNADFTVANLADADLTQASIQNTVFDGADLRGATLTQVSSNNTRFREADLRGNDLGNITFLNADFRDARLASVNLSGANLQNADLRGADLTGADLSNADLLNADFTGAKLAGATLEGANTQNTVGLQALPD